MDIQVETESYVEITPESTDMLYNFPMPTDVAIKAITACFRTMNGTKAETVLKAAKRDGVSRFGRIGVQYGKLGNVDIYTLIEL